MALELPDNPLTHPHRITLDDVLDAIESGDEHGFCLACGCEAFVEPDARNVQCETCAAFQVFGSDELLMRLA